ncbi:MAG: chemotaxis protein CheC [Anaerolineae bacterium]|jgi:chemotaxis protein CheC
MSGDCFAGAKLEDILEQLAGAATQHAAQGLSTMLGSPIRIEVPKVELVPLGGVCERVGGPECEVVGIYLTVGGDLPGHVMLITPMEDALRLVDMLLEVPAGTVEELGPLERSALGEVGNVVASLFLNAIADATGMSARPSPPSVMTDMLAAVLNVILAPVGLISDEMLLLETELHGPDRRVRMHFWLVPSPDMATAGRELCY